MGMGGGFPPPFPFLMNEEYKECLSRKLSIRHLRGATATTTDSLLLAAFLKPVEGEAAELGAGGGIVSLLAASRGRFHHADLYERDATLAALAAKNVEENRLSERLTVLCADVRELVGRRYLSVYANPPYRRANEGRGAKNPLADLARFERAGTLFDFIAAAERILLPGGSLSLVLPGARLPDAEAAFAEVGLRLAERVSVYPYPGGVPKLCLLRAEREVCRPRLSRFTLARERAGAPTREALALYEEGILFTEGDTE